jgi:Cu+-exporting ATPase
MDIGNCFHCGNEIIKKEEIIFDEKSFCCNGCKTVYEILSQNDLTCYYDFQASPGATPLDIQGKYDFLDNEEYCCKTSRIPRGYNTYCFTLYSSYTL